MKTMKYVMGIIFLSVKIILMFAILFGFAYFVYVQAETHIQPEEKHYTEPTVETPSESDGWIPIETVLSEEEEREIFSHFQYILPGEDISQMRYEEDDK